MKSPQLTKHEKLPLHHMQTGRRSKGLSGEHRRTPRSDEVYDSPTASGEERRPNASAHTIEMGVTSASECMYHLRQRASVVRGGSCHNHYWINTEPVRDLPALVRVKPY